MGAVRKPPISHASSTRRAKRTHYLGNYSPMSYNHAYGDGEVAARKASHGPAKVSPGLLSIGGLQEVRVAAWDLGHRRLARERPFLHAQATSVESCAGGENRWVDRRRHGGLCDLSYMGHLANANDRLHGRGAAPALKVAFLLAAPNTMRGRVACPSRGQGGGQSSRHGKSGDH